jgi:RHS repeat-associated protein
MTSYGSVLTAGYRADGLRGWKQSGTARTYFLYDGILPIIEMDSSGSITATTSFSTLGLVSRREGSTSVFYTFDSEGNVAQRSDATGTVLSNHMLDSHGALRSGSLSEPFGYKGQFGYYTDQETGLQLLTHRYYDPSRGRFLTQDPLGHAGGINLYSYVANNPINSLDRTGLCADEDPCNDPTNWNRRIADARAIGDLAGFLVDDYGNINRINTIYPQDVEERLENHGFTSFIDLHPAHFGYNDYEGAIDGRWYHISVRRGDKTSPSGRSFWTSKYKNVTIHCEEGYYRPSGWHRIDWAIKNVVPYILF